MSWDDQAIERLRFLWGTGMSTKQISLSMGMSKNAIVGKAHRLELEGRPSPIPSNGLPPSPRPNRSKATLPALSPAEKATELLTLGHSVQEVNRQTGVPRESLAIMRDSAGIPSYARADNRRHALAAKMLPTITISRTPKCLWPIGEPRAKNFRFCGDPTQPGKPYCVSHAKVAYVSRSVRKDDEADAQGTVNRP